MFPPPAPGLLDKQHGGEGGGGDLGKANHCVAAPLARRPDGPAAVLEAPQGARICPAGVLTHGGGGRSTQNESQQIFSSCGTNAYFDTTYEQLMAFRKIWTEKLLMIFRSAGGKRAFGCKQWSSVVI